MTAPSNEFAWNRRVLVVPIDGADAVIAVCDERRFTADKKNRRECFALADLLAVVPNVFISSGKRRET
ncbi:hypothetical protein Y043_5556 [Burkholderia pseudomallei MSHR2138]|nr:hypothetical protein Y043_5556 [Burkholderia pseudomallei MSHR2138]KGX47473.1 hypothetical protein Y600_5895 [Burkholderia pseudomallei MSHR3709]